jgi:DNA-binding MltR family transcriptional regulator
MMYHQGIKSAIAARELGDDSPDRAVAVVGGAIIDHVVTLALKDRFVEDTSDDGPVRRMLKDTGPLGPTQNKITMLRLLDVIDERTMKALVAIVRIRNAFAHSLEMKFGAGHPKLTEPTRDLTLAKGLTHYPKPPGFEDADMPQVEMEPQDSQRRIFVANVKIATLILGGKRLRTGGWEDAV